MYEAATLDSQSFGADFRLHQEGEQVWMWKVILEGWRPRVVE